MLKKISLLAILLAVTACGSEQSPQVQAMQKKDKQLTCKEVLLEMNEAQFYQKMAQKNKGPNLKNVLMPLGYISTYVSANDAIEAASARVEYLDKIYSIMDCEAQKANGWQSQSNNAAYYPSAPMQPVQPMPVQPQYIPSNYSNNGYMMQDPRMQQQMMPQQQARMAPPASVPPYHYPDDQATPPLPAEQRMY